MKIKTILLILLSLSVFLITGNSFGDTKQNSSEDPGNKEETADSYNRLGNMYYDQGNYSAATEYYVKSLQIREEINDKPGIAISYNNIGSISAVQGFYSRAMEYYFKSLRLAEELEFKGLTAQLYNNIGDVYTRTGKHNRALEYHFKSLRIREETGEKIRISDSYNNIGNIYKILGDFNRALEYQLKSLRIREELGDKLRISGTYHSIGIFYKELGRLKNSRDFLLKGLKLAEEMDAKDNIKMFCKDLSEIYEAHKNYKEALAYHRRYAELNENLFNREKTREIAGIQTRYEVEKKEKEKQILAQNNQIDRLNLAKQQNMVVTLVGLAGLLFILAFLSFNRFRLKKKANILIQAEKENAEQANLAKSRFLANMSHEIRTPLNAILGFSEILSGETTNPQHKSYLQTVSSSGKTLLELLNDVLDLSRIEAGKMELHYEAADPCNLLEDIRQIFSTKAKEKDLDIQVEIDPALPETLLLDALRMRQVLLNLTGNAVKFTDRGFIKLSASVAPGDSSAENSRDALNVSRDTRLDVVFAVQDSGIGIPEEQRQHIFEAFQQLQGQEMEKYGGAGLGLAICHRFVEMMGGEISLESGPGKGSTFRVLLKNVAVPAAKKEKEIEKQPPLETIRFEPAVPADGKKASILVVDDKEDNRRLLIKYLADSPFEFIEAENGKEALEKVKQHQPALVLLDYKMPVKNGIETCKILKAHETLKSIPVIIVTASALKEQRGEIAKAGCDGLLVQPVSKNDLFLELKKFLPYTVIETAQPAAGAETEAAALSPEALEKLPGLLSMLRGKEVTGKWETLKETRVLGEIKAFALEMQDLGREYESVILSRWAEQLHEPVQSFDIEKIEEVLSTFPGLIEEIAAAGNSV